MNLIKGYLPIQISLPSIGNISGRNTNTSNPAKTETEQEDSFIFVKQHTSNTTGTDDVSSRTLFVTNAPIYPNIRTNILLRCIFERFGDIEKVVVAPKPNKTMDDEVNGNGSGGQESEDTEDLALAMFKNEVGSFGGILGGASSSSSSNGCGLSLDEDKWYDQGRYAHIVFSKAKQLKKCLSSFTSKKNRTTSKIIKFGKLEIQELQDISRSQFLKEQKKFMKFNNNESDGSDDDDDDDDDDDKAEQERPKGLMALVQLHRSRTPSRQALQSICEKIMMKYEEEEGDARERQLAATNAPDEDGFITVSHSTIGMVGDAMDFERKGTLGRTGDSANRRAQKERNRSTRSNVAKGSDQLQDFYRFQLKENKKRTVEDLKLRFEDDLRRVKKMKDNKMYKPF